MFNPDGSRAFCGNGTLCVARWAAVVAGLPASLAIETDHGVLATEQDVPSGFLRLDGQFQ